MDIKGVSHKHFGTSVPYSGRTKFQLYNQLPMISCYVQGFPVVEASLLMLIKYKG
jgi:hypothetical protein